MAEARAGAPAPAGLESAAVPARAAAAAVPAAAGVPAAAAARVDLVSFDLDGTLVDTACEIAEAVNRGLESLGFARWPAQQVIHLVGAGLPVLVERVHAGLCEREPEHARTLTVAQLMAAVDAQYLEVTGTLGQAYPGALETLDRLRAAGVRLACVTNKETRHALRVLEVTGLGVRLDLLVGGDTLPWKKPHAGVLQHVLRHFGVAPRRTAHVGDSSIDVAAARNAGVLAWAVSYGYNAGVPIAESQPDRVFDRLAAVADLALDGTCFTVQPPP